MRAAAKLYSDHDNIIPQEPEEFNEDPLATSEIVNDSVSGTVVNEQIVVESSTQPVKRSKRIANQAHKV